MLRLLFILFLIISHGILDAQVDSNTILSAKGPEVNIIGYLSESTVLDSQDADNTIAELLSTDLGIQIQSQGGPYLQTAMYRGQSARHMAILWEGVNIQNSFNGTYDLGLLPASIFSNSKWYDGGNAARLGTAAMSGVLELNQSNKQSKIAAGVYYNNQHNRRYNVETNYTYGKLTQSVLINKVKNLNEYRYAVIDSIVTRKNAMHEQFDLSYLANIDWSAKMRTRMAYWYQDVDRSLPPATISNNIANQKDRNHRFSVGHDWQMSSDLYWTTKAAYMNEYLGFFQAGIASEASNDIVNLISSLKYSKVIDHTLGFAYRYEEGQLEDKINPNFEAFYPKRSTIGVYYNGLWKAKKSTISMSARQEWIDSDTQTPTGQVAYRYDVSNQLCYTLGIGRHYNYAGFNDLYWPLGGNPDLKTEKSWQYEGGIVYRGLSIKAYQIYTRDKILWAPNSQNIWTPDNLASTKSSGIECKYRGKISLSKLIQFSYTPIINYNYTINTSKGNNEGKELLYNPRTNIRLLLDLRYSNFEGNVNYGYTGLRYQSLDNFSKLDPYQLLDLSIAYRLKFRSSTSGKIYFGLKNSLDQSYELVRYYPQALRSFYLGANISVK